MKRLPLEQRRRIMASIRKKNTNPELVVRRVASRIGHRYQVHDGDLPGSPDLVFSKLRKVVFVHGCFWHQHSQCKLARIPKRNREYWFPKFARNSARDSAVKRKLTRLGWDYLVVWECQTRLVDKLRERLSRFLD